MNAKQQFENLLKQLKKPQTIFLFVAVIGLMPLLLSFVSTFLPNTQSKSQSDEELQAMLKEGSELRQSPIPEPFRQDTAREWLRKIPVEENHAELLRLLLQLETDSGVRIERFELGGEEEEAGDLVDQLNEEMEKAEAVNAKEEEEGNKGPDSPLLAELVNLEITGGYAQVIQFWALLADMERVVSVDEWNLSAYEQTAANSQDIPAEPGQKVLLSFSFHMYIAPAFADLAGPEGAAESEPVLSNRTDPTLSDQHFYLTD